MYGRFMLAAVAAIAVLGVDDALAQNTKKYGASQCFILSGSNFYVSYGTIANGAGSALLVDCGAVKEGSLSISSGFVTVRDLHPTENVECDLHSSIVNGSGWSSNSAGLQSSAGSSFNWQTLNFGSVTTFSNGHYYYTCRVPAISSGNASGVASRPE